MDAAGNFYIAGSASAEGAGGNDILLVKYEAGSGNYLWTRMWGYFYSEHGTAMTIDPAGNILVAGTTQSLDPEQGNDMVLLKYDTGGNLLQALAWGIEGIDEQCLGVSADAAGITLAGMIEGDPEEDALLVRLDTAGGYLWGRSFGGTAADLCLAAVPGPSGGIAAGGVTGHGGAEPRVTLAFFDEGGGLLRGQSWSAEPSGLGAMIAAGDGFILGGNAPAGAGGWQVVAPTVTILGDRTRALAGYSINTPPSSLLFPTGTASVPVAYLEDTGGGGADALIIRYSPGSTI